MSVIKTRLGNPNENFVLVLLSNLRILKHPDN